VNVGENSVTGGHLFVFSVSNGTTLSLDVDVETTVVELLKTAVSLSTSGGGEPPGNGTNAVKLE
jgi:hypothetical protein